MNATPTVPLQPLAIRPAAIRAHHRREAGTLVDLDELPQKAAAAR